MLEHVWLLLKNNLKNNLFKRYFSFICMSISPILIVILFCGMETKGATHGRTALGFLIMFIFFKAFSSMERVIDDRYYNIYGRILTSSIKVYEYYLASILCATVIMVFQIFVCLFSLKYILRLNLGVGYINLFIVLFFIGMVALSVATLGICITSNYDKLNVISYFISMGFSILGGCYFSVQDMPLVVQKIAYFIPTTWAMEGIDKLLLGYRINKIWADILMMILFSLTFFILGVYIARKSERIRVE